MSSVIVSGAAGQAPVPARCVDPLRDMERHLHVIRARVTITAREWDQVRETTSGSAICLSASDKVILSSSGLL